jgi:prepilin-type N-terminal cleavage/methylation domain-containing protein
MFVRGLRDKILIMKSKRGFSLVETVVATAIFVIIAMAIYQGFLSTNQLISASRDKIAATDLMNSEFELIRNMPFGSVGLIGGIPVGPLSATSTMIKDGRTFEVSRVIRNIDDPFDGTIGGDPNDLSPADYKIVQIDIKCLDCKHPLSLSAISNIAPKNLETSSENGALFVRILDAAGLPVAGANVEVQNSGLGININETTNNSGLLQIVDAPPSENGYRISVSKNGYSSDRTYSPSVDNPNPVKPDATVLLQQLTQVSFLIDKTSTINVFSKNPQCVPVSNVPFSIAGGKLIGTGPDVLKWSGNFSTDSSGVKVLSGVEWDSFDVSVTGGFDLFGVNPPLPFTLLPDSVQDVDLILAVGEPKNLLVTVKDINDLPLSGVSLNLTQGEFSDTKMTGRGYLEQSDWSGGGGQQNFTESTMYSQQDGNIETLSPAGEIKLVSSEGSYVPQGTLTSSIFDTGEFSNFSNIVWSPTSQSVETGDESLRFQLATAEDNTATTTWEYLGPDGTQGSFYTTADSNISDIHNGDRYFRYKVFLSTADAGFTPSVSGVAVTYTSDCIPSGQALWQGLSADEYVLRLEKSGYQSQEITVSTEDDWQNVGVILLPE